MARQNGQATWVTPITAVAGTNKAVGDLTTTAGVVRGFLATERMTVTEVGAAAIDSTNVPSSAFTFRVKLRTGGLIANDMIIPLFSSTFAAEGGPGGDTSNQNFDFANALAGGIVTNTAASLTAGKVLRAYTEVTLNKGDMLMFEVVGTSSGGAVAFYATAYYDGKGLVETNDVESN